LRLFPTLKSLFVLNARGPALLFCSALDSPVGFFLFMKFIPRRKPLVITAVMKLTAIPDR